MQPASIQLLNLLGSIKLVHRLPNHLREFANTPSVSTKLLGLEDMTKGNSVAVPATIMDMAQSVQDHAAELAVLSPQRLSTALIC